MYNELYLKIKKKFEVKLKKTIKLLLNLNLKYKLASIESYK